MKDVVFDIPRFESRDEQYDESYDEESDESIESSAPYQEPEIVTVVEIPGAYPVGTGSHTRMI